MQNVTSPSVNRSYPWPPEINLFYPYINLYEFTEDHWKGLLLQQSFDFVSQNFTNIRGAGWIAVWTYNYTLVNDYYYKYYDGTKKQMFICNPVLVANYKEHPNDINCFNYTPKTSDYLDKLNDLGYVYNSEKPMVDIMIALTTVLVVFGAFGK